MLEHGYLFIILLFASGLIAGTVDAIAGGGGLISIPVLMAVGLPPQVVLGTNKLQSSVGTLIATINYFRHGLITIKDVTKGLISCLLGASLGAVIAQVINPAILGKIIIIAMIVVFIYSVSSPKLGLQERQPKMQVSTFFIVFGFIFGFYDGFFGPGAGSFWAIAMVFFLGYHLARATAYTKLFNLESNLVALLWFICGHNVNYKIGLTMACGQIIGGRLGSYLVIKNGAKLVRPIFLIVVLITIVFMLYRSGLPNSLFPSDKQLIIDNHKIYYNETGRGETILLLHGMFAKKEQWKAITPLLKAHPYHVIAIDLPGYGKSPGYSLKDYELNNEVIFIHDFMEKLHISKFDIAGNSMGGVLAALYTLKYPQQIISVAFIGSPLGIISPQPSETDKLFKKGLNPFVPTNESEFNRLMALIFAKPPVVEKAQMEQFINESNSQKAQRYQITQMVQRYSRFFEKSRPITQPVLIIWGNKDKIFDISGAKKLKKNLKNSTLVILPNIGHLPHIEDPKVTADVYLKFLKSQ